MPNSFNFFQFINLVSQPVPLQERLVKLTELEIFYENRATRCPALKKYFCMVLHLVLFTEEKNGGKNTT